MKPRAPDSGRSKTDLRRGRAERPRVQEAPTTDAEQNFLFEMGTPGAPDGSNPLLMRSPEKDDPADKGDTSVPL